jgi:hypothetical protein
VHYCKFCQIYYCEDCLIGKLKGICKKCNTCKISRDIPLRKLKELSYYRFLCPNNKHGCSQRLFFEIYQNHLDKCLYEPMLCFFPECDQKVFRRKYLEHVQLCQHRITTCQFCSQSINSNQLESHYVECPKREVQCSGCNKYMLNQFLQDHLQICGKVDLVCDDCEAPLDKKYPLSHSQVDCISLQMNRFYTASNEKISSLKSQVIKVSTAWENLQNFMNLDCVLCKKKSCQVALKNCGECFHKFCSSCAKRTFTNCKVCSRIFCKPCFEFIKLENEQGCKKCCLNQPI